MDSTNNSTSNFSETIARLSGKAGVKSAMVVDRIHNTILMSSGSFLPFRGSTVANPPPSSTSTTSSLLAAQEESGQKDEGAHELATMVWNYVKTTDGLVRGLDGEDEIKLLRLRTKKHELVIVPDAKYIFVVVHETPPS